MVNSLKIPPKGIDIPIQEFQNRLYTALDTMLCFDADTDYECYGRCYKNQVQDGYIPEVYIPNTDEYKEVLLDDTTKMQSFFVVGDNTDLADSEGIVDVALVFHVDLCKLNLIGVPHRLDEEFRRAVYLECKKIGLGFTITGIETGVDNVFREFRGARVRQGLYARDMHPLHCFRINMTLRYYPEEC